MIDANDLGFIAVGDGSHNGLERRGRAPVEEDELVDASDVEPGLAGSLERTGHAHANGDDGAAWGYGNRTDVEDGGSESF